MNECPWRRAAQGTAAPWGGRGLAAKARMLLPSYQHRTWEWQWLPGGTDTEATLILCNNCAHREMLTLSHTDGAGAGHSRHMAERLTASMCWVQSQPLISQAGNTPWAAHTQSHSQALFSLPSSSFVTYPAQVLKN